MVKIYKWQDKRGALVAEETESSFSQRWETVEGEGARDRATHLYENTKSGGSGFCKRR
ncbi:MAG: hypothetical protein J7K87_03920 [Candidatus Aenigmarchaeota archaeon]|nr:hypothetical protein [Candidatus Aenigmarchaeota archaeon]